MKDVNILTSNGVNVEQSLELFGDMEMYDETLNDFLDMVEEKLANLEKFKLASDMPNYAIEVHSLKSDARYLGFTTLADLSYQSEMKSKAGDIIFIQDNHPAIIAEARRMIAVANQYLGKAAAPAPAPVAPVAPAPMPAAPAPTPVAPAPMPAAPAPMPAAPAPMPAAPAPMPAAPAPMPAAPGPMPAAPGPMPAAPGPMPAAPAPMPAAPGPMPVSPANPSLGVNAVPSYPGIQAMAPKKDGTILVVDDSNLVANFVKKIFDIQYDVILAHDGQKAIEIVDDANNRAKIRCVLLDLNMPNVDGFAVLDHFKQNNYFVKLPVAVVSGVEDTLSMDRVNVYPIVDILAKPFNERDVKRVVDKCLATYF